MRADMTRNKPPVVDLATLLARSGQQTLVLDCGARLDASRNFGIEVGAGEPMHGKHARLVEGREHLGILPVEFAPASVNDPGQDPASARSSFADWQFVIADLPPAEEVPREIVEILDGVIILMLSSRFSLQSLGACMNTVTDMKGRFNPGLEIEGILITQADRKLEQFERTLRATARHFPVDVFPFAIPQDDAYAGEGWPRACGATTAPSARATRGYVELAMEVLSHDR